MKNLPWPETCGRCYFELDNKPNPMLKDYLQEEKKEFEKKLHRVARFACIAFSGVEKGEEMDFFNNFINHDVSAKSLRGWLKEHDERLLAKVREMVETKIKENNRWKKEGVCYLCIEDNHCIHDIENVAYNEVLSSLEA